MAKQPNYGNDCIQILKFIVSKTDNLNLRMSGRRIIKLIKKCECNFDDLQFIHSLIDCAYFVGNGDIIRTALIHSFGKCSKNIKMSLCVFESMQNCENVIAIC